MDYHSPKRVPIYGIRASIQSSISMDARRGVTGRGGASLQSHVESGEGVWEEGLLMWHTHPTGNGVCLVLPGGAGSGEGADDV